MLGLLAQLSRAQTRRTLARPAETKLAGRNIIALSPFACRPGGQIECDWPAARGLIIKPQRGRAALLPPRPWPCLVGRRPRRELARLGARRRPGRQAGRLSLPAGRDPFRANSLEPELVSGLLCRRGAGQPLPVGQLISRRPSSAHESSAQSKRLAAHSIGLPAARPPPLIWAAAGANRADGGGVGMRRPTPDARTSPISGRHSPQSPNSTGQRRKQCSRRAAGAELIKSAWLADFMG